MVTGLSNITNGAFGIDNGSLKISVSTVKTGQGYVEELSQVVSAVLGTNSINDLVIAGNDIYIGATSGKFLRFNTVTNSVTDLSNKISSFWGTIAINTLTYDSINKVVYLGGGTGGKFGRYNTPEYTGANLKYPASDTAYDLSSRFGLNSLFFFHDMIFDFKRDDIYATVYESKGCGSIMLLRYSPASDTAISNINSCSNPCFPYPSACAAFSLAFDFDTDTIYAGGRGTWWGGLHTYSVTSELTAVVSRDRQ